MIIGFLARSFGISTLLSTVLVWGVIAAAAWGAWEWRYHSGYVAGVTNERAVWQALALEAKIKKLELELQVQKDADAFDEAAKRELEAEIARLKEQTDAYIESHGNDGQCLLGDDGAKL